MSWNEVLRRRTVDSISGEVVEDITTKGVPFSTAAAGRRLDRVRDIRTVVELLPATPSKPSWADLTSEDEELTT